MISVERNSDPDAVEHVARALYQSATRGPARWTLLPEERRERYREQAKVAITAYREWARAPMIRRSGTA